VQRSHGSSSSRFATALGLAVALLLGACSGGDGSVLFSSSGGSGGGSPVDLNLDDVNGSPTGITANGRDLTTDGSACAAQAYEGETIPLDIYIMFDHGGRLVLRRSRRAELGQALRRQLRSRVGSGRAPGVYGRL
jgi:hypothetical protein